MRQHEKYQTICDYTPTISHDMSVTHDIKRCKTPMQKLQALIYAYKNTQESICEQVDSFFFPNIFCQMPQKNCNTCAKHGKLI